jgi:hypothetical protein
VMMIRCFLYVLYCTPKYVLVVGGTGTVEKHDVICDDVSISGWQTEDSIAVATIKVPEQIGIFTNVYQVRLFVLVVFSRHLSSSGNGNTLTRLIQGA